MHQKYPLAERPQQLRLYPKPFNLLLQRQHNRLLWRQKAG